MDYGLLPPEINSARMYAGPGSSPMLAAAAAWNGLAAELRSTATSYQSVISALTGNGWQGPASTSMTAAAAPYVAWMSTTAGQAEQTAQQANAAAAAYEAAYGMTVPPPVIAANRSLLTSLVATNVLGQNTPAIAATEAHYGEMWAQDAAAMYGYAGNSAAAAKVTPFTEPAQTTNPAGQAGQAAAVSQATTGAAGNGAQSMMSSIPQALQGLASPMASSSSGAGSIFSPGSGTATSGLAGFLNTIDGNTSSAAGVFANSTLINGVVSGGYLSPVLISQATTGAFSGIGFLSLLEGGPAALNPTILMSDVAPSSGAGTLGLGQLVSSPLGSPGLGGSAVSAGMGRASLVGSLSAPQSWASTAPVTSPPATATLASGWTAAPDVAAGEMHGMPGMPGMPMVGSGGRGFGFAAPRYGFKPTVMAHPPAAG